MGEHTTRDPCRATGDAFDRRRLVRGLAGLAVAATAGSAGWRGLRGGSAENRPRGTPIAGPAASPVASPAAGVQVTIDNFSFVPATLTVAVGTAVTWVNHDDIPHTVTSADKTSFGSPLLDTDDTFSHRFDAAGSFSYFCSLHPFMTGKIVVQ